ncbi:hypothetical protein BH11CYA1_BH11CYA1_02550 [soil metagenome]
MKEVSNYAQGNDNVVVGIEKHSNTMGNIAADIWKDNAASLGSKDLTNDYKTKCGGLTNLQIDGLDTKPTKGGCSGGAIVFEPAPDKPSNLDSLAKPFVKPEIPADGGLKDPIKEIVKVPSLDGGIKKPFKPISGDTIEFGETFIKPVPKK